MAYTPVVVVTGATRGIGLAVVKQLLQTYNANVIAISRSRTPELDALASDKLQILQADVTDEAALTSAVQTGLSHFHHIDALVLNAGIIDPLGRVSSDAGLDQWRKHFDVNFFSLITAVRAGLPQLRQSKQEGGGRIVLISSGAANGGVVGWGPYNASKAAMNSLGRTLATEEPDVTTIALRPGMVDTDMQTVLRANGREHMAPDSYQFFVDQHESGKLIKPEDSARSIAALALRAPKELSGQFIDWNADNVKSLW